MNIGFLKFINYKVVNIIDFIKILGQIRIVMDTI